MTFSFTVFHGSSWSNSWNTIMRSGPGSCTTSPLSRISPSTGLHVAAHRLQQRRLAAARRPEQDEAIRPEDLEIDPVGRRDQMVAWSCTAASRRGRRAAGPQRRPGRRDRLLRSSRRVRRLLLVVMDWRPATGRRSESTLPPVTMIPTRLPRTSSVPSSRHASGTADGRLDDKLHPLPGQPHRPHDACFAAPCRSHPHARCNAANVRSESDRAQAVGNRARWSGSGSTRPSES